MSETCPTCQSRGTTPEHQTRCERLQMHRQAAIDHGATYSVPAATTADLWAHLGHVASAEDATRIVRQVLDLGWRPVVGSNPARLWKRGEQ